ncbi:hypothetical protein BDF22DRAFT_658215 [Syncephalis plumigaleata]|nr:hypothetical protein BDF22DRAFT_658215 [Syncephalis plumigaleata]
MAYQKELGLSDIRWCGGNKYELRLARVIWNNQIAFMKCDRASIEIRAFNALKNMKEGLDTMDLKKKLDPVYAIGRQNVMDPLHQFEFYEENRTRYFCYLYSYIDGTVLPEYFKKHTISHAFITAAKILPEVIKGAIYLYNAGIIHEDLYPKTGVKIIDLDATEVFRKEQDWQPINPNTNEYLSPNPRQYHKSCDEFKETIVKFLNVFLLLEKEGNPFDPKYVLAEQATQNCLGKFKQGLRYAEVELDNANVMTLAQHDHTTTGIVV